jgi:hypothetical protein
MLRQLADELDAEAAQIEAEALQLTLGMLRPGTRFDPTVLAMPEEPTVISRERGPADDLVSHGASSQTAGRERRCAVDAEAICDLSGQPT